METSAKNSINVDESFITLARDIKKRLIDNAEPNSVNAPDKDIKKLGPGGNNNGAAAKKGCCS
jgi:Ras-related protein Rab-8A